MTLGSSADSEQLFNAVEKFPNIEEKLADAQLALFLDYDGTLSPIVNDPTKAIMSPAMREAVRLASTKFPTVVVTGRKLETIWKFVQLDGLHFAGGHGHDICGPDRTVLKRIGEEFVPDLMQVADLLNTSLLGIEGYSIEDNRHSISIHYRDVPDEAAVQQALAIVEDVLQSFSERLRMTHGNKVWEIRPNMKWDKGHAIEYFLSTVFPNKNLIPIHIGDDKTDEDAFREVNEKDGISILVTSLRKDTRASYVLTDPSQVETFLGKLVASKRILKSKF